MAEGWAKLGIGNHPSPHDVAAGPIYPSGDRGLRSNLLLLGATPSLHMAARHPGPLHGPRYSPEMIEGDHCMTEKPVRETVAGDWIETVPAAYI